jgi:hypothetical protein
VIDGEPVILEELERLAPAAEVPPRQWADVIARVGGQPSSVVDHNRLRIAAAAVIALLAVAAPALGLSASLRQFLGFERPTPVLNKAHLLVSAPVGNGFFAHDWDSPSSTGGRCFFQTRDHTLTVLHPPTVGGAGGCSMNGSRPPLRASAQVPLNVGLGIDRRPSSGIAANWVPPTVDGAVFPALHASRVVVTWRGGRHQLVLRNGYFLGGTPALYMPPFARFPFYVVAYDRRGTEVARSKLQSSTLSLLSGKQFARDYLAWKKKAPQG